MPRASRRLQPRAFDAEQRAALAAAIRGELFAAIARAAGSAPETLKSGRRPRWQSTDVPARSARCGDLVRGGVVRGFVAAVLRDVSDRRQDPRRSTDEPVVEIGGLAGGVRVGRHLVGVELADRWRALADPGDGSESPVGPHPNLRPPRAVPSHIRTRTIAGDKVKIRHRSSGTAGTCVILGWNGTACHLHRCSADPRGAFSPSDRPVQMTSTWRPEWRIRRSATSAIRIGSPMSRISTSPPRPTTDACSTKHRLRDCHEVARDVGWVTVTWTAVRESVLKHAEHRATAPSTFPKRTLR